DWRAATPTILVLAALAFLSMRQQGFWRDTEALWLRQFAVYPLSPTGNHHLGFWYLERAEPAKAEPYLRASVVAAPTYPGPRLTLAGLLVSTSRPDEALATIEPVLSVTQDPKELAPALFLAARIHWDAG